MDFERHCAEIVDQAELLRSAIDGADLAAPVPSCPGWDLGHLLRHVGGVHRWAETIVRTRATQPPSHPHAYPAEPGSDLGKWLVEGAQDLADALLAAGPGTPVWTPVPGGTMRFYARRFTHETLIHRADAFLAVGTAFTTDPAVGIDAIDEWMELGSLPMHFDVHPWTRELLGPGRTVGFRATDVPAGWLMDLTGDVITWRRTDEEAAVTVHGGLTDLLLIIYKRRPPRVPGNEIRGDAEFLDFWLDRVSFG